MFHTWGSAGLQLSLAMGNTMVLRRKFSPAECLADIERTKAGGHGGPVAAHVGATRQGAQGRHVEPADHRRQRLGHRGAAGQEGAQGVWTGALQPLRLHRGQLGFHRHPAELQDHPDTAGRAPVGTQLEVLDEDGHQVDGGVVGRVFVGNGMLFEGYTRVGEDKEVVRGMMSTGDLGHLDDGLLYIDGRSDDMVVSGGENVYPGEVEDLINELDGVREVVVVGVDDEKFGARLAAYVVREPNSGGEPVDSDSIRAHVKAGLARFSVPRDVVFLDELPRNATGKVVARDLPSSTE